ncbi:MAG: DUF1801 domain-containing protein [Phycisphaerales bacterium]|nr:DUF1801 domain-containing protein [Phycisphaerales bacterium]
MPTTPQTVPEYLKVLPEDRRAAMKKLRSTIKANLPKGFKEMMNYGMPSWVVPHSRYPGGYHCDPSLPLPFLAIASQKSHVGVYHMGLYADAKLMKWFQGEYPKHVKTKLDMGKSCIRFKKVEAIPCDLIGELCGRMTPDEWIALYEKNVKA